MSAWLENVQRPIKRSGKPTNWRRSQSVFLSGKQAKERYARTPVEPLDSTANPAPKNLGQTWDKNPLKQASFCLAAVDMDAICVQTV
jgi:hypothetical protein